METFDQSLDISAITTYQAGATQAFVHRRLQKICDAILRPFNITKMQWLIIGAVLDTHPQGVRLTDLAEKLGTTLSFMTNSVNLLESRRILVRNDNTTDTRSKLIFVNDEYVAMCSEIEVTLRNGLRKTIYAKIDPAEFRVYLRVQSQLAGVGSKNSQKVQN